MPSVNPGQRFSRMTLEEVSERTGRSVVLLRRWARQGRIPAERIGRMWFLDESDLAVVEAIPHRGWPRGKPRKGRAMEEGHYKRMRRSAYKLLTDPIDKAGKDWPRHVAEKRLDEWDAEAERRGDEDRERLDYWKDGLRWIEEKYPSR